MTATTATTATTARTISGYSLGVSFIADSRSLAKNIRLALSEISENVAFSDLTKDQVINGLSTLLNEAIPAWLHSGRVETDKRDWENFGAKIASAMQGHADMKGVKVYCRFRDESEKMTEPKASSLASGYGKVLARSTDTKEFYRWVSWEISFPTIKRVKDAFDTMAYEGSTRDDNENAYPLAAAPALLGTERPIVQDSALKDMVQAAQLATIEAKNDVRLSIRAIRTDRTISELKTAAHAMHDENVALKTENAYLKAIIEQMKAKTTKAKTTKAKTTA